MPKHLEFNRDGFKFSLTGDAVTIWDCIEEKKVSQYLYDTIEEALYMFRAFYRVFA